MNSDSTHISVLLDRSGSMQAICNDIIGGFNAFLHSQQTAPGTATLTLAQFDSLNPYEIIHESKPLTLVPDLTRETFVPRGATPLLDAMGQTIGVLSENLSRLSEEERPAKVVVVIVTDGQENSSARFTRDMINLMVNRMQNAGWQFVFLSADLAAIVDARNFGVRRQSSMAFDRDPQHISSAWSSVSSRLSDYRSGYSDDVSFSDQDVSTCTFQKSSAPEILNLKYRGKVLTLGRGNLRLTIGREHCDLTLCERKASRKHAEIFWDGNCYILRDYSTNGTYIRFGHDQELVLHGRRIRLCGWGTLGFGGKFAENSDFGLEFEHAMALT